MKHCSGGMARFFLMVTLALPATLFAEPERPSVVVTASHPATGSVLPLNQPLYLRIRYQSAAPLRFQAATPFADKTGAMFNPSPLYPSGQGEALVWIAFRADRHLDEVRVKVLDEQWRPVQSLRVPVRARWSASAPAVAEAIPRWTLELNRLQQEKVNAPVVSGNGGGDWWIQLMALCLPGYLVLQVLVWRRWRGGWRRAGLLPLWVAVPLLAYTLFALLAGSNLWPLMLLFLSPLLLLYLVMLFVARAVRGT